MRRDWHYADIIAGLKKRGTSLSALSRQAGRATPTQQIALRATLTLHDLQEAA